MFQSILLQIPLIALHLLIAGRHHDDFFLRIRNLLSYLIVDLDRAFHLDVDPDPLYI
jgi:hypothetical protein